MSVKQTSPDCWAVVHGHEQKTGSKRDKPPGTIIKEFCGAKARERAESMHAAIVIRQAMDLAYGN